MAWDHVEEEICTFIIRSSNSVATMVSNVISINSCVVSHSVDLSEGPPIIACSGLSMFVYSIVHKLNVSIRKVIGTSNIAEGGANFLICFFGDNRAESIRIMNITSAMANCMPTIK